MEKNVRGAHVDCRMKSENEVVDRKKPMTKMANVILHKTLGTGGTASRTETSLLREETNVVVGREQKPLCQSDSRGGVINGRLVVKRALLNHVKLKKFVIYQIRNLIEQSKFTFNVDSAKTIKNDEFDQGSPER